MPDQIGGGERVGRKPHRCAYCAGTIPVGERHAWWTYADGGTVRTSRGHLACERAWFASEHHREAWDDLLPDPHTFRTEVLGEQEAGDA